MNCGMPVIPFLGMWSVMMAAMMLPSLLPVLRRSGSPVTLAGGYFMVWVLLGAALFGLGIERLQLAAPAVGLVVAIAGALQFSSWKQRHLARCGMAAQSGVRLGLHCVCSCAGPTAVMLVMGMMDPWVMAAVTTAISAERLAPAGKRIAQATGIIAIVVGSAMMLEGVFATPDFREHQGGVGIGRHADRGFHVSKVGAQEGIGLPLDP